MMDQTIQDFEQIEIEIPVSRNFIVAIRRSSRGLQLTIEDLLSTYLTTKIATILPDPDLTADAITRGMSIQDCLVDGLIKLLQKKQGILQTNSTFKNQPPYTISLLLELPKLLVDAMRTAATRTGTTLAGIVTLLICDHFNYRIMTT